MPRQLPVVVVGCSFTRAIWGSTSSEDVKKKRSKTNIVRRLDIEAWQSSTKIEAILEELRSGQSAVCLARDRSMGRSLLHGQFMRVLTSLGLATSRPASRPLCFRSLPHSWISWSGDCSALASGSSSPFTFYPVVRTCPPSFLCLFTSAYHSSSPTGFFFFFFFFFFF